MAEDFEDLVRDVLAAPLGEVIASVGRGVAEAQAALDAGSIAQTLEIYREGGTDELRVMREIGYRPTFYSLPETTGEVRVSLNLGNAAQSPTTPVAATPAARMTALTQLKARTVKPYVTPVNAGYANRYSYSAEASTKITFRIVPVPAPDGADEIREMPEVLGRPVGEALELLTGLGFDPVVVDTTGTVQAEPADALKVSAQFPAHATILRASDEVILTIPAG